jgi:colanic acid biosynthesis glycosyl transferase WcaI
MKRRVCCVVNHFDPDTGGGGAVYSDMIYALAERGHDVTVICPIAFYPEFRDKEGRNGLRIYHERRPNLSIHRYGFVIPRAPRSLLQRLVFELSLTLSMLRALPLIRGHDALVVFVPYFAQLVVGALAKISFRAPAWLNVQDIMSDAAETTGHSRHGSVFSAMRALEKRLFKQFDVLSTISPKMADRLRDRDRSRPVLLIPNWPDQRLLAALDAAPEAHERQRPERPLRLLYAGNIGAKQNLLTFCELVANSEADLVFEICGSGSAAAEVEQFIARRSDPRLRFEPFLPLERFAARLKAADLYVVTERSGVGGSFFPSKLMSAFAAGTPVLALSDRESPLGTEMREAAPGPHFTWQELDRIADLLLELRPGDRRLVEWSERALKRAETYDRTVVIDRIERLLTSLIERNPR